MLRVHQQIITKASHTTSIKKIINTNYIGAHSFRSHNHRTPSSFKGLLEIHWNTGVKQKLQYVFWSVWSSISILVRIPEQVFTKTIHRNNQISMLCVCVWDWGILKYGQRIYDLFLRKRFISKQLAKHWSFPFKPGLFIKHSSLMFLLVRVAGKEGRWGGAEGHWCTSSLVTSI